MSKSGKMVKFAKYGVDGQIHFIGEMPDWMIELQGDYTYAGEADPRTQYIDLVSKELRTYTPAEQAAKDNIPHGWTWKMPEKRAVDLRSAEQQSQDVLSQVRINRQRSYPPLADFADALYWQSKGDNGPMDRYLAACDKVKQDFPKPNVV